MSHKTFQPESRIILKNRNRRKFTCARGEDSLGEKKSEEKNGGDTKGKHLFWGQSARSKHWFYLDILWVEENSVQENLSFTRGCFKSIFNVDMDPNILYFMFPFPLKSTTPRPSSFKCDYPMGNWQQLMQKMTPYFAHTFTGYFTTIEQFIGQC